MMILCRILVLRSGRNEFAIPTTSPASTNCVTYGFAMGGFWVPNLETPIGVKLMFGGKILEGRGYLTSAVRLGRVNYTPWSKARYSSATCPGVQGSHIFGMSELRQTPKKRIYSDNPVSGVCERYNLRVITIP